MIPIGDDNRDRHRTPYFTILFLVVNVAVFLYELSLDGQHPALLERFIRGWGVVPVEYANGVDIPPEVPGPFWITLFSSMFLHGGWGHLGGNMLYLWVFGDNVEDRFGHLAFVLFYLGTGLAGALAQVLVDPGSTTPMVGASGAISGVLGAYIVLHPFKRVHVILFYFVTDVPALLVIGMWAATQFLAGAGSIARAAEAAESGGVAYMAHVGGFVAGVVAAFVLRSTVGARLGQKPLDEFRRR